MSNENELEKMLIEEFKPVFTREYLEAGYTKEVAEKKGLEHAKRMAKRVKEKEKEYLPPKTTRIQISMSEKEIREARRVGIPENIISKMDRGIGLYEHEKAIVKQYGKVYVAGYMKEGVRVRPQLRNLPK